MTVVLFLGGVPLMVLGVVGERLGRVFNETRQRPLYRMQHCIPSGIRVGR
jgi:polyisoprenyl-phosphate glycosyltransferase